MGLALHPHHHAVQGVGYSLWAGEERGFQRGWLGPPNSTSPGAQGRPFDRGEHHCQACLGSGGPNPEAGESTSSPWSSPLPRDTSHPPALLPAVIRPSVCLFLSLKGVGAGGQGQGAQQINMALVFPEARAVLMMGLIERRSVKRILIDLTSLIRICV